VEQRRAAVDHLGKLHAAAAGVLGRFQAFPLASVEFPSILGSLVIDLHRCSVGPAPGKSSRRPTAAINRCTPPTEPTALPLYPLAREIGSASPKEPEGIGPFPSRALG